MDCKLPLNQIIQEDFLEISSSWPDECIDLIVADPPYNSAVEWDKKDNEWQEKWLREAYRLLKKEGSLYFFFAPLKCSKVFSLVEELFSLRNLIVWNHRNLYGSGISYGKDRYKSTWEIVFYAVKEKGKNVQQRAYNYYRNSFDVVVESAILKNRLHKAQKPLKLLTRFIQCSSDENDIVLDPFCGSGSTCLVAKTLNRNFIGVEIDSKFAGVARRRVELEILGVNDITKPDKAIF